jgi:hypothetical protein
MTKKEIDIQNDKEQEDKIKSRLDSKKVQFTKQTMQNVDAC